MSDSRDMDMVNERLFQLNELVSSIKTQNALNIGDTSRALNNIGIKLDSLSSENADAVIKSLLEQLQKTIDDRYSIINLKFTEIDSIFKSLLAKNEEVLTEANVKELFDVISTNISVFSKQVMTQGDILNEITLRIEALRTDDTQKREITKSISSLKADLDKFNNGFESIVLNVNESANNILTKIELINVPNEFQELKSSIQEVFLSLNALVSSTQIFDKKQELLETAINNMPNFDEIKAQKEILEELISQTSKLNASVRALAGQSDFDALITKVEDAQQVIHALKADIIETNNQSKGFLITNLDNLEKTVENILSQEDFNEFKAELSSIVLEVVQTSNVIRGDILSTTSELKNLTAVLNSLDFKTTFEQIQGALNIAENNVKASIDEFGAKLIQENEAVVSRNINELSNKMDLVNENVAKISNHTADKLSVNLNEISNKLLLLQDEVNQNNNIHSEKFVQRYDQLTDKLSSLNMSLDNLSTLGLNSLKYNIEELLQKVESANTASLETAKSTYGELIERLKNISQSIEILDSKSTAADNNNNGLEYILATITTLAKQIEGIKNNLNLDFSNNFNKLKELLTFMPDIIKENHISVEEEKRHFIENASSELQELTDYVKEIQNYTQRDSSLTDGLVGDVKLAKEMLFELRHNLNFNEELAAKFTSLETVIARIAGDYDSSLYNVQNKLLEFLKVIRENCETTDIKLGNSIFEISAIQTEIQKIFYDLKNVYELQADNNSETLKNLSLKIDTILNSIALTPYGISENANPSDVSQINLNGLEEKLDSLLGAIKEERTNPSNENVRDIDSQNGLVRIEAKITQLKELLSFSTTNLIEEQNKNFQAFLQPVNEAMSDFLNIDFQNVVKEIKTQMEYYSLNFKGIFDEIKDSEQKGLLDNLFNGLAVLNSKIQTLDSEITEKQTNMLLEMKFVIEKTRDILEETRHVEINVDEITAKIDEKLSTICENVDEKFAQIHDKFNQLNGRIDEIHSRFDEFEQLKNYQEQIVNEVQNLKLVIEKGDFEAISQINTKIDNIQKSLANYKPSADFHQINVENIKNIGDEDKSIIMAFSQNLSELVSIIQVSTKALDKKITAISNKSSGNSDLKPQLSEILSALDEKLKNVSINPELIKESLISISAQNKEEILNKLEKISSSEEFFNKLDSLSKRMDIIALNDGIKYNIEKNLSDIKAILENQQKTFKPFEILETLNTLNDIKKLKGIEQLSKLNDIISIDKLNALNKLNLLDKLDSIERLDDIQKLPKLSGMIEVQADLAESVADLRGRLEKFTQNYTDMGSFSNQVETYCEQLKTEFKKYVLDLYNQISFVVESEDIKSFVENKNSMLLNELNKIVNKLNMIQANSAENPENGVYSLKNLASDMESLKLTVEDFHKNNNPEEFSLISQNIGMIAQALENLKFDFTRQDLDKMKFDMEKMHADTINMSSRVNKILLKIDEIKTSKPSSAVINTENHPQTVINTDFEEVINSNKIIGNNVYKIQEFLKELNLNLPKNNNIMILLEERFRQQQDRIDSLEQKIESLTTSLESQSINQLTKKMNNIDKQLAKLNKSIDQLTAYVDDEE